MSQKTVTAYIYGKEYALACDAGQEQHLVDLIHEINARTVQLERAVGKLPEAMMLLYTALMVADELHDAKRDSATARQELALAQQHLDTTSAQDERLSTLEEDVADSLHAIAHRIEGLADQLVLPGTAQ